LHAVLIDGEWVSLNGAFRPKAALRIPAALSIIEIRNSQRVGTEIAQVDRPRAPSLSS